MPSPLQLHGPLASTSGGWADAVRALAAPATRAAVLGPGHLPVVMSNHDTAAGWFELVTRPLWGLAPLAAGGGVATTEWTELRAALTAAVDPAHPWYVGDPRAVDQRLVEAGAVGYALATAPEQLWDPLSGPERDHLAAWLTKACEQPVADTNWHFFPVLASLGLENAGVRHDTAAREEHLARTMRFALDDAWYEDGPGGRVDYYNPFAFHWYGLAYARITGDHRFVARAVEAAHRFRHWFAADGAAVPYGRSLAYRFAQGALWGAFADADVEALPWAELRALAQRHLEWWWNQPILDSAGHLTVGYRYPNDAVVEQYVTAGSPYWSLKFFAPLATSPDHPFWTVEPAEPHREKIHITAQPAARAILARDADGDVVRLNGQAWHPWARNGQAAYAKFAYSTLAGFSVPTAGPGIESFAPDGTLALSEDGRHWRAREDSDEGHVDESGDGVLTIAWRPWPDVTIRTRLLPRPPWHIRIHHITTGRELHTAEGGWCTPWCPGEARHTSARAAWTGTGDVHSLIADLDGGRTPAVIEPMPGTHLLWPQTVLPVLTGTVAPGEHVLACAVRVGRAPVDPVVPASLLTVGDGTSFNG